MTAAIKPPRLRPGATIGVVASSSPVADRALVDRGVARLEQAGYRVRFLPHSGKAHGYLAGTPQERAADLHEAFADDTVDAVLQLRGGYGAVQVLPLLDWQLLRAHPKPLIGMSDTTVLHTAVRRRAGLVTFWGPGLTGVGRATPRTWQRLLATLGCAAAPEPVRAAAGDPPVAALRPGVAEGELVGGTTALITSTVGTPWQVHTRNRILLLEDVNEEPYRLDRMLTQLGQAGILTAAAGIVFGEHVGIRPRGSFPAGSLELDQILRSVVRPLRVPVLYGLPLGHGRQMAPVPLGVRARLDADAGELVLLESGVC